MNSKSTREILISKSNFTAALEEFLRRIKEIPDNQSLTDLKLGVDSNGTISLPADWQDQDLIPITLTTKEQGVQVQYFG